MSDQQLCFVQNHDVAHRAVASANFETTYYIHESKRHQLLLASFAASDYLITKLCIPLNLIFKQKRDPGRLKISNIDSLCGT
jgi:hypothetical protein